MIAFDKEIYKKKAIEKAIVDYSHITQIHCIETEKNYECQVTSPRTDIQIIQHEFSNYVLNLTVAMNGDAQ